jgi:hypothetical protein
MSSISENCSLFEIDNELDTLLEQIEEQVETEGEPSEELLSRFGEFCVAHGEKVDRIGRFVRMAVTNQFHRAIIHGMAPRPSFPSSSAPGGASVRGTFAVKSR